MKLDSTMLLMLAAAGAAVMVYLANRKTAAPYSIYPSMAWMDPTSLAKAKTAANSKIAVLPVAQYADVQQAAQQAVYTQCAGGYPGCSIFMTDTQLGL